MHDSAGPCIERHSSRRPRRRLLRAALPALVALGLAAGCERPPEPDEVARRAAVEAALDSAYATFTEAYARANIQLLMDEVYAEDAFYLPPDSPILRSVAWDQRG